MTHNTKKSWERLMARWIGCLTTVCFHRIGRKSEAKSLAPKNLEISSTRTAINTPQLLPLHEVKLILSSPMIPVITSCTICGNSIAWLKQMWSKQKPGGPFWQGTRRVESAFVDGGHVVTLLASCGKSTNRTRMSFEVVHSSAWHLVLMTVSGRGVCYATHGKRTMGWDTIE